MHVLTDTVQLGGDGTVLFTSWLFQRIVPPVLPFALGSLGFLTNFDFADHQSVMDSVIDNGIRVNLRMRFTCTVYRAVRGHEGKSKRKAVKKGDTGEIMMRNIEKGGWEALEGGSAHEHRAQKDKEIMCFTTRPVESFEVINDLVIDRGPSPYVSMLELFGARPFIRFSLIHCVLTLVSLDRRRPPYDDGTGRRLDDLDANGLDRILGALSLAVLA
jgi:NAD+ kinase